MTEILPAAPGRVSAEQAPLPSRFIRLLLIVLTLVFLVCLGIFAIRLAFVVQASDLFITTGEEGPGIYAIWKVQHGHPLYEWPDRENYALTIYNYLFYYLYAGVLGVLGITDGRIPSHGRLLTLLFACAGIAVHWAVVARFLPRPLGGAVRLLAIPILILNWIGPSSVAWWCITVRPDLPAVVICLGALLLLLRGLDGGSLAHYLAASAVFFLAWSLKQSIVLTLGGCLLYLFFTRRWRPFLALALPFFFGCVAALVIGGAVYRRNILFMPSIAPFAIPLAVKNLIEVIAPNALIWVLPAFVPWALGSIRPGTAANGQDRAFSSRDRLILLLTVALTTFLGGAVSIGKFGASRNYMLEAMAHATVLCIFVLAWCAESGDERPRRLARVAAAGLALSCLLLPAMTLLFPRGLGGLFHWNLVFGDAGDYRDRKAFIHALHTAPRPLLMVDPIISQPWYATHGKYPALVIDTGSWKLAQQQGIVPKALLEELLNKGVYAAAVAPRDSDLARHSAAMGFQMQRLPVFVSAGGPRSDAMVLITRPAGPGLQAGSGGE